MKAHLFFRFIRLSLALAFLFTMIACRPQTGEGTNSGSPSRTTASPFPTYTPQPTFPPQATYTTAPQPVEIVSSEKTFYPFEKITSFIGPGGLLDQMVGPGPQFGSERLYLSYVYKRYTFNIVAADVETGKTTVFPSPLASEWGAWSMVNSPDGKIYVSTQPYAHFLSLDPSTGQFTDLGIPVEGEGNIWQLILGPDGKIYGITAPNNYLFSYSLHNNKFENLGQVFPTPHIARFLTCSTDGFIYVGVGYETAHVMAYEIATQTWLEITPDQQKVPGVALVYQRSDGKAYAWVGEVYLALNGFRAESAIQVPPPPTRNTLKNGKLAVVLPYPAPSTRISIIDPLTNKSRGVDMDYQGGPLPIFRLGNGPDGIYGSSVMPARLFRFSPLDGSIDSIGELGGGEIYSMISYNKQLILGGYGVVGPVMVYDPGLPFQPDHSTTPNPRMITGLDDGWRPQAVIQIPNGKVLFGATAGYGQLDGTLLEFDPRTEKYKAYHPVPGHAIASITSVKGVVVGGTSIHGGGATNPKYKSAVIFIWNPTSHETIFTSSTESKAESIYNIITGDNGLVYAISDDRLIVVDPVKAKIIQQTPLSFSNPISNSLIKDSAGNIWGLCGDGIVRINTGNNTIQKVAYTPEPVDSGVAIQGQFLYYASGNTIYRYNLLGK